MAYAFARWNIATWILTMGAFVMVIAVVAGYSERESRIARVLFFENALASAHVSEVITIDSERYTVQGSNIFSSSGKLLHTENPLPILRLAYEKSVARRNPLYALAGTNLEELSAALEALTQTQQSLAQIQPTSTDSSLLEALYPIPFLRAAAKAETARGIFLQEGTLSNAHKYTTTLAETIKTYRDNLANFEVAFAKAVPEGAHTYATDTYLIRRDDILNALASLRDRNRVVSDIFSKRIKCFKGYTRNCDERDLYLSTIENRASPTDPKALSLSGEVRSILKQSGAVSYAQSEPLVALSESTCVRKHAHIAPLFVARPNAQASPSEPPVFFVGDIRFIRSNTYRTVPYFAHFSDNDIPYVSAAQHRYYECPTAGSDAGAVFATLAVRDFALRSPLSQYASGELRATLVHIENSLSSAVVEQADAVEYLNAALPLMRDPQTPENVLSDIISLFVAMRSKSAGLEKNIREISRLETSNIELVRRGIGLDLSLPYLFAVRSAFPTLFLFDDVSARTTRGSLFPANDLAIDDTPYEYYSHLQSPTLYEELVRDISFHNTLHKP